MYLRCHPEWEQSQAVSDVVYPPMGTDPFALQGFPPVYTKRGKTPSAAAPEEGKPLGGSSGTSAAGGMGTPGPVPF